ncbi:MAG: hypothetical protein ACTS5F_01535 [Candidatus Hodgkinia cicadicola]
MLTLTQNDLITLEQSLSVYVAQVNETNCLSLLCRLSSVTASEVSVWFKAHLRGAFRNLNNSRKWKPLTCFQSKWVVTSQQQTASKWTSEVHITIALGDNSAKVNRKHLFEFSKNCKRTYIMLTIGWIIKLSGGRNQSITMDLKRTLKRSLVSAVDKQRYIGGHFNVGRTFWFGPFENR